MIIGQDMGNVLFELRHIAYLIFQDKMGNYSSLFVSTTILMFLIEIKNAYKIRKLERALRVCEKKLEGR